ncbi:MAG: TetR family transcriptional regulator [Hyphomicrobiaceae bacterium]
MIDTATPKGRILAAAFALAAERPWAEITLADIADKAGVPLVDLKAAFDGKAAMLAAFSTLVDDEMLRRAPRRAPDQSTRDALFEVIMSRFDALGPYRLALKSIAASGPADLGHLRAILDAQHWMLAAAGVSNDGAAGLARAAGLATVYASVFRTWLDDEDPGFARTMAVLDRRLRRGESVLNRVDDVYTGAQRIASTLLPSIFGRKPKPEPEPETPAPPSTTTPGT